MKQTNERFAVDLKTRFTKQLAFNCFGELVSYGEIEDLFLVHRPKVIENVKLKSWGKKLSIMNWKIIKARIMIDHFSIHHSPLFNFTFSFCILISSQNPSATSDRSFVS